MRVCILRHGKTDQRSSVKSAFGVSRSGRSARQPILTTSGMVIKLFHMFVLEVTLLSPHLIHARLVFSFWLAPGPGTKS